MIFDSIRLENFGAYGGVQEAILTPDDKRPVVLFGGMNGGGKTTLLDALQLVLYGAKAKVSNRGRMGYLDYLGECIHRSADRKKGASITLQFHRTMDGKTARFSIFRSWSDGSKGLREALVVSRDGHYDESFTENWDEIIETFLPSSTSNLFFFDGEQIEELAESSNAATILGSAIRSLLGLDLVDRLENDLRVLERRKGKEGADPETSRQFALAQAELDRVDQAQADLVSEEARLKTSIDRGAKELEEKKKQFRTQGGDLFVRRSELTAKLEELVRERNNIETQLRDVATGPLPLIFIGSLLEKVESQALHENGIRHSRHLLEALEERDETVVKLLRSAKLDSATLKTVTVELSKDRNGRKSVAGERLVLNGDDHLHNVIAHLRHQIIPAARSRAEALVSELTRIQERIVRAESDLGRVPEEDQIAQLQSTLEQAVLDHHTKIAELETLAVRSEVLKRQRAAAESRFDRFGDRDIEGRMGEDARLRILKHSKRVRGTLDDFRTRVIARHVSNMEALMLQAFRDLLRKGRLVNGLSIDPKSFEVTLKDKIGRLIPFDRLSAGERQLLATAMLWGLARASGRSIPTVIDTPLGRLDSAHRKHLIERYFPFASHQVLLLSTDEEIVGKYHESLRPFVTRHYNLVHDESLDQTSIQPGYFDAHETAR